MGIYSGGTQQIGEAVRALGRVNTGVPSTAVRSSDICDSAVSAIGRQSPASSNLVSQCYAARISQIKGGSYVPTAAFSPNDPAYRVALTEAGEAVVARNPALQSERASLAGDAARGFTMAQGVRAGLVDPFFVAWVVPGLGGSGSELGRAFLQYVNAPAPGTQQLTQGPAGPSDEGGGIPRPVLIGGAAVAVLGVAALVFKMTR